MNALSKTLFIVASSVCFFAHAAYAEISVKDAWVRATLGAGKVTAGYAEITNDGASDEELLSVSTPSAAMTQLHKTEEVDGVMKMMPVATVQVPAGQTVALKPGGMHIMLMNVSQPLKDGDFVDLLLTFRGQGAIKVRAKVVPVSVERQRRH